MFDIRPRTKRELKQLFTNLKRKGITDEMAAILIDLCYNEPVNFRTSGFYWPGSPDSMIEFNNTTRTFTITPRPADPEVEGSEDYVPHFRLYSWAKKPVLHDKGSAESIVLPDEEGLYIIHYQTNSETGLQELSYIKNPDSGEIAVIYLIGVIVAWVYWNAAANKAEYFGEERHGSEWNPSVHVWAHDAFNALRDFGLRITDLTIGDGSADAHAQVGISAGAVFHEDIYNLVEDAIASTAGIPILYHSAAGPRITTKATFPVATAGTGRLAYNSGSGLTEAGDGKFLFCHIFWTNCLINPFIAVTGQQVFDEAREAVDAYMTELESLDTWMPHQTKLLITSLLYETSNGFSNGVKGRIVGEMTPEGIADIVSEDNIPSLKTGWNPDIQGHMMMSYTEASHTLALLLTAEFTTYFVKGVKHKITGNILFNVLPSRLGMNYITGTGNNWVLNNENWDDSSADYVKVAAMYRTPRQSQTQYMGWRMHPWEMEAVTRGNIIKKTGLEKLSGFELSINATNDWEIDVADGTLRLADILANVNNYAGSLFGQYLRSLRARRHYLKTYVDDTDPEDIIITHEWEYVGSPDAYVATLDGDNEVVINEKVDDIWQLTPTTDGDYSAMWLVGCLDFRFPLKWITGGFADADLETAKTLNDAASLKAIIDAAQFIIDKNTYQVLARVIVKNIVAEPYYELVEIEEYEDGEFEEETEDRHVIDMNFDEGTRTLTLKRNAGLPDLTAEIPGGGEENVQSDWNQANTEADDYIKNKPTIPAAQIQSDWTQADTEALDYIKNKPTNTDEKVKFDAADPTAGYLSEKIVAGTNVTITEGTGANENKLVVSASGGSSYTPKQVTGLILLSTGWTLVSGLYEYDLADANITATSSVEVIPANTSIATVIEAVIYPQTDSSSGIVKIYAENEPTADISVTINIFEMT